MQQMFSGHRADSPCCLSGLCFFLQFILVHFYIRYFHQIFDQIIMIFIAHLISHGITDRMYGRLVIHLHIFFQLFMQLLHLLHSRMFLHNQELITAKAGQKAVFIQYSCQKCSKVPDERIPFIMPVGIIDHFQIIQIKHHHAYVQCIFPVLKLRQFFLQTLFIMDASHVNGSTLHDALTVIFQCQRQRTSQYCQSQHDYAEKSHHFPLVFAHM